MSAPILILSLHSMDFDRARSDTARFSLLVRLLREAGLEASHRAFDSHERLLRILDEESPKVVFNSAYAIEGEKVQALVEARGLPFIGSPSRVLDLAISKPDLKEAWIARGVMTAPYLRFRAGELRTRKALEALRRAGDYPYILKPSLEGNSRGISSDPMARDETELRMKAEALLERYSDIMAESYLGDDGTREFTVAVVGNGEASRLGAVEIVSKETGRWAVVTGADKDGHRTVALPIKDERLRERVETFAREAFAVAGVQDYARGDFMLSGGRLYAIEVNGQPMLPDAWFAACCDAMGMDEDEYPLAVFLAGMSRLEAEGACPITVPRETLERMRLGPIEAARGRAT